MQTFGQRFGALVYQKRDKRKWSRKTLAEIAFKGQYAESEERLRAKINTIERLEKGLTHKPHVRTTYMLCLALNITIEELLDCESPDEQRAIEERLLGNWSGSATQKNHLEFGDIDFGQSVEFEPISGKILSGTCTLEYPDVLKSVEEMVEMEFTAQVRFQNIIYIKYANTSRSILQFGSALLDLDEDKDRLKGQFIGFGPTSDGIVGGTMDLYKQTE